MFGIPNPQALLQPWKNLTHFTEELFAMLTSRAPVEREGPVTIRVPQGQTALRIERADDEPSFARQGPLRARPAPPQAPPSVVERAVRGSEVRSRPTPPAYESIGRDQPLPAPPPPLVTPPPLSAPSPLPAPPQIVQPPIPLPPPPPKFDQVPLVSIDGPVAFTGPDPVKFQAPPQVYDQASGKYRTLAFNSPDLPGTPSPPEDGGTTVFIGKVVSGSGDTYSVALYPDGPNGGAGDTVEVQIPTIDADETIDPNTWLFGIFQFTDEEGNETYFCQPPIWTA